MAEPNPSLAVLTLSSPSMPLTTNLLVSGARVDSLRLNQDGRLDLLEQNSRCVISRYRPVEATSLYPLALPSLLALTRGEVKVTVAANRWRLLKFTGGAAQAI